jgi:fructose-1-phosphate kinase PfkB-like protein
MSPRIVTFTVNPALDVAMEARRSPPRPQNTGLAGRRTIQVVASWDEYE